MKIVGYEKAVVCSCLDAAAAVTGEFINRITHDQRDVAVRSLCMHHAANARNPSTRHMHDLSIYTTVNAIRSSHGRCLFFLV